MQVPVRHNNSDPCSEELRLAALRTYGVLDTPAEGPYDDITRLLAQLCQTPVALISFIETDRQWFKSEVGLGIRQTPRDISFCQHAILQTDVLIIPDAMADDRFRHNPLVVGPPHFRFYAGAPLINPDGHALGTLCVLDYQPRTLSENQVEALRTLARQVMTQLELRRLLAEKNQAFDDLKRMDEYLRRAKGEADAANRAKDRFFAVLSHELRAPLHPALMISASLASEPEMPERFREDIQLIHRNIALEASLIDSMLDLTRISNGKLELHVQPLDLRRIVADAVATAQKEAEAKSITVSLEAIRHGFVNGDSPKLQQVFGNLLRNAIKFTPTGGSIQVRMSSSGGTFQIAVSDDGVGIDKDVLPRVFEAFEQGRSGVTREYGGLGLGLAICKGIVTAHGGSITASSAGKDRGTTMTVELPALAMPDRAEAGPPAAAPTTSAAPGALNILLVEDHEDTLRAMARLLRKLEHSVTTATSVGDALAAASKSDFDLVISDVGLPDGTGLELMRSLLARKPCKGIALTGYGMESDIDSTRKAGFAAHLTKPVSFQDLASMIQKVSR